MKVPATGPEIREDEIEHVETLFRTIQSEFRSRPARLKAIEDEKWERDRRAGDPPWRVVGQSDHPWQVDNW